LLKPSDGTAPPSRPRPCLGLGAGEARADLGRQPLDDIVGEAVAAQRIVAHLAIGERPRGGDLGLRRGRAAGLGRFAGRLRRSDGGGAGESKEQGSEELHGGVPSQSSLRYKAKTQPDLRGA
jgi:hypothetical protein